jgi:hypothetical protein
LLFEVEELVLDAPLLLFLFMKNCSCCLLNSYYPGLRVPLTMDNCYC